MTKKFNLNKKGKIEFTPDELKKLLDEVYWEGYKDNSFIYKTPNYSYTGTPYYPTDIWYTTTTSTDSNIITYSTSNSTLTDAQHSIQNLKNVTSDLGV